MHGSGEADSAEMQWPARDAPVRRSTPDPAADFLALFAFSGSKQEPGRLHGQNDLSGRSSLLTQAVGVGHLLQRKNCVDVNVEQAVLDEGG